MSDLSPLLLALYEPDIAQNAGAMMRTCACLGVDAAIIEPAGFPVSDRRFRRAGMDYLDHLAIQRHASFERFETWRRTTADSRPTINTSPGRKAKSQSCESPFVVSSTSRRAVVRLHVSNRSNEA